MAGLRNICKMYGGIVIDGVKYVWDYANNEPVEESEMQPGSERWKASERERYKIR